MSESLTQNITPIGLLSAAIRRERERLNLSVTELAKRGYRQVHVVAARSRQR